MREYSEKFDQWSPPAFRLTAAEIEDASASLPTQVIADIEFAQTQIRNFALAQRAALKTSKCRRCPASCWDTRTSRSTASAVMSPGGRYPMVAQRT